MRPTAIVFVAAAALTGAMAAAQPGEIPAVAELSEQAGSELSFDFTIGGEYMFESNLDDASGDVSIARVPARFSMSGDLTDRVALRVVVAAESSFYDFSGPTSLAPGAASPIDDAYLVSIGPTLDFKLDDHWGLIVGGRVMWAAESGADWGSAFTGGGSAGLRYSPNRDFTIGFGATVLSRIEDDARVVPLVILNWRISDTMTLSSEAAGLVLSNKIRDDLTVRVRGRWEPREYRLDDSGPLPDGVLRDERVLLGAELAWAPSENVELAFEGGGVLYQNFESLNSSGSKVGETDADPAFYLALRVRFRF